MDESIGKIQSALSSEGLDAVLALGVDNFTYLSRIVLPFASNYPDRQAAVIRTRNGRGFILCPFDWEAAVRDQGWNGDVGVYDENSGLPPRGFVRALREILVRLRLGNAKIGVDEARVPKLLMDLLGKELPDAKWLPFDSKLRELRLIKTSPEVKLIETASNQSELGIITALMHLEGAVEVPGYTINEFTERVRVHVFEFGGSGVGHVATQVGADAQMFYGPQRGKFREKQLVRINITNHMKGYWSNAGRMAVIGRPTPEQSKSYGNNLKLKSVAVDMLKPGVPCNEVFAAVKKAADGKGISFWEEPGIGHGIGVSHREPPFLNPFEETLIRSGMVIVLDLYNYGPRRELIHSKDTYEITEDGCKLLSWYKNWDKLYAVTGFRSTH